MIEGENTTIMPTGLALIDYKLLSVLSLIADEIMPIGLALIDYKLVSVRH